jgi:hypothetical protein
MQGRRAFKEGPKKEKGRKGREGMKKGGRIGSRRRKRLREGEDSLRQVKRAGEKGGGVGGGEPNMKARGSR